MYSYSYNKLIITVINAVILEFFSDRFAHQGALLPFYLFLSRVRT